MSAWQMYQHMMNQMQQEQTWNWNAKGSKGKGKGGGAYWKGKGKGKGDHTAPHQPKGKGKGYNYVQNKQDDQDTECKCCGKLGHSKPNCHHLGKMCGACGVQGHLTAVCKHKVASNDAGGDSKATAGGSDQKKEKNTWLCTECWKTNDDDKVKKCRKTKGCTGTTVKNALKESTEDEADQPTGLSKISKGLIADTDPEKVKEEQDQLAAEHATLVEHLEKCQAMNDYWKKTGGEAGKHPIETHHQKKRISDIPI